MERKNKPVNSYREGTVSASVFVNGDEKNIALQIGYNINGEWMHSSLSIPESKLKEVIKVLTDCVSPK